MQNVLKKTKYFTLYLSVIYLSFLSLLIPEKAQAAWKKAGISPQGTAANSKLYTDLGNIVYFITAIGGFWVLGCLIFAGMRLSAAQGGNPQARTQGFTGILMAGIGIFVIVKAKTIAGWFAGIA